MAQLTTKQKIARLIGATGLTVATLVYVREPSFPTPDKILVFLILIGLCFGQAWQLLKRLGPFVLLLAVYESFRGLAHHLNTHVHYLWMPRFDEWLFFGELPTAWLQSYLWHGRVQWYDFVLYLVYMLHFVMPLLLAVLIWKFQDKNYWRFMASYVVLSFAGFLTYTAVPAAPPWMASDLGLIQPIERISSHVWYSLGVHDFPSLYNQIAPNPVAAVPSLHTAYAVLFALCVWKFFGRRWGGLALPYPVLMVFGIVYQGEHYVVDALLGIVYAYGAFYAAQWYFARRASAKAKSPAPKSRP